MTIIAWHRKKGHTLQEAKNLRSSDRLPSANAAVSRPEVGRSTALLLCIPPPAIVIAVATGSTVCAVTTSTTTDTSWARGASGLFVCGGNDFSWKVEPMETPSSQRTESYLIST